MEKLPVNNLFYHFIFQIFNIHGSFDCDFTEVKFYLIPFLTFGIKIELILDVESGTYFMLTCSISRYK